MGPRSFFAGKTDFAGSAARRKANMGEKRGLQPGGGENGNENCLFRAKNFVKIGAENKGGDPI